MTLIDKNNLSDALAKFYDKINTKYSTKEELTSGLATKADSDHGTHLTLGTGSGNAFRGDYGNTAYEHSQAVHAPSNAQKNSDITKAEIEAKLTGAITSHTHSYLSTSGGTLTGALTISDGSKNLTMGTGGADVFIANNISGKFLQLKDNGDLGYSDNIILHSANYNSYALPLTGGTLSGRLHADGKLSVRARGGSWIDTVNFDNVAIANNTEPHSGAYFPLLAARTEGMHTMSLGSNYTGFGFYGFKNGRTENGVDLQFIFDVNAHTTYTDTWMKIDNGMEVNGDLNAGSFRLTNAPGNHNCYIGGGNGDSAGWDSHNMIIRSHWGIGFHDYQDACRIVFDTRNGNINTRGLLYSEGGVSTTQWIHADGSLSAGGGATIGGHTYINAMSVSDKITGETKVSVDGGWSDPWEGVGCAIKAHGSIATNYTVKTGYLNTAQGEFNGAPGVNDSFIKIYTGQDGNGQGDALTHLGYNNGDGYHHFFRGTGAMHVHMHQGLQVSNDFIYLAGIPLTISGNPPSRGGVWIQI